MNKAFFIAGPVMKRIGLTDEVQGILERSGVSSVVFSEVAPDPPVEEVEKAAKLYLDEGCDGIIAMGGGSSLDAAKGVAIKVSHPGPIVEYDAMVAGTGKIKEPMPPIMCIPTTAGTGSEVNQYAVITDTKRDVKFIIMSDRLIPKLALVDPNLCRTMPKGLTAETGVDALAHCIEGYVGNIIPYHPYYSALAFYGVMLTGKSLRRAYNTPDDIDARSDMCMAAINGGICFTKGLGIGHAIGHVLGAHYHVSHGKALSASLLCFARANKEACQKEFEELAWALDHSNDLEAALTKLYQDLNMPTRLSELEIPEGDLAKIAFDVTKDVPNMIGNPIPLSESQILKALKEFY